MFPMQTQWSHIDRDRPEKRPWRHNMVDLSDITALAYLSMTSHVRPLTSQHGGPLTSQLGDLWRHNTADLWRHNIFTTRRTSDVTTWWSLTSKHGGNTNVLIWPHKNPASSPLITLKLYEVCPLFGKKLRFFWNGRTFDDKGDHWALNSAIYEKNPSEHVAPLCLYYEVVICEAYGYFFDFKLGARS